MKFQAVSVDDELINLLILEEMAKTADIDIASFENPLKAIEYIANNHVDIIFVDYIMPEMDGIALIRHIRTTMLDIPIIMVTSLGERRDIKLQALDAGANEFLTKPVDSAEFLTRTKNLIALRRSQLQLKDRAMHLEEEVRKATKVIADREFETLVVLGRAAEYKDPETAMHIDRVAYTSRMLAVAKGLPTYQQDLIFHAAPLHDVGKMGIPDSILLKPGRLTADEFIVMKTHSEIGFNILKNSKSSVLSVGSQIAMTHHERYDGKGYPRALADSKIPLFGRIVTVADCYDAMISKRPYKEAMPATKVLEIMVAEKGKQFDPEIVDLLISRIHEVQRVYEKLKDL